MTHFESGLGTLERSSTNLGFRSLTRRGKKLNLDIARAGRLSGESI